MHLIVENKYIDIAIWIAILIFSSIIHEIAHAWVALRCGDQTAKEQGRITLNPLAHICPINSILIPLVLYFSVGFIIGGAKPVPIDPRRLRHPDRDMALSAAAGPISNLLIVLFMIIILCVSKFITKEQYLSNAYDNFFIIRLLLSIIVLNLILAFFNLLPIPPLDGSRIARYLFPFLKDLYNMLDMFGIIVIIMIFQFFPDVFNVVMKALIFVWNGINELYTWI